MWARGNNDTQSEEHAGVNKAGEFYVLTTAFILAFIDRLFLLEVCLTDLAWAYPGV